MWNKLSQAAGLASVESESERTENIDSKLEDKERLQQQEVLIQQLKDVVRENEQRFQDKSKEYDELASKFQKFKLQSKAKISHLSSQIKEQEKPLKKEDCDFDDTSSSDSSDQSRRGKVLLLKKQLDQVKQQLEKQEEESRKVISNYERKINDLELQLNEKNILISTFASEESNKKDRESSDASPKKESNMQEMYAQIVYKDSKIMELNNQILEHEKKIMDLQEHVREKDEVLQQRNRAVQLMAEDMSRKGKSVVDELDETREQMKIMQENFSTAESDWKKDLEKYKSKISELENEIFEFDKKLKNSEAMAKSIEAARYELSVKNAELQKKIVCVQESAAKQCELYNKEIGGEVEALKKSLESEKQRSAELQKSLDESSSQSDNKVLKARVKERTKFKALERELNELKKANQEKPEVIELQQRVAVLEEEKGSLQLKLMDIEDQVIQYDKLKEENETLQKTVENQLNEIQNLKKQIGEVQAEREDREIKFKTLHESHKDLEEKFKIVDKEKTELKENLSVLHTTKEKIESDYNKLRDEHNSMQIAYDDAAQHLQQLQDQKVTFEMKNIELEEIRENDEKEKRELLTRIEKLKESFSSESRPDIQLEKENLELKEKLREQTDNCMKLENKATKLLSEIDCLREKLANDQKEHSSEIHQLNNELKHVNLNYEKAVESLEGKKEESIEKEKIINELKTNFSDVQKGLSDLYLCIGAKSINDCKNYTIKKAEELSDLKNNFEKLTKEKDNLMLSLQGKDEELQKYALKLEKLQSILENRDSELKSLEAVIEKLKETVSEKENIIHQISSELKEITHSEKSLEETMQEKTQLLLNAEQQQRNLENELQYLKEAQSAYQEKMKANNLSLLGQITDLETELDALREELTLKVKTIDDLNGTLFGLQSEYKNALSVLEEKEKVIEEKNSVIENAESTCNLIHVELQSLKEDKDYFKIEISNKDSQIMELNEKLLQLESKSKAKEVELSKVCKELQEATEICLANEQAMQILKEKNTILETEKLNSNLSFTEKDAAHKQILEEKVHLETEFQKLQEENKSLSLLLDGMKQESAMLNETINKMIKVINEPDSNLQDFLMNLSSSNDRLGELAGKYVSDIKKMQAENQNLTSKNADLQSSVEEMQSSISDQHLRLQEFGMTIASLKKEYEELTTKNEGLESNLNLLNELKCTLESQVSECQHKIQTLSEENNVLKSSINSSQEEYLLQISSLKDEIFKCQSELKNAYDTISTHENEHLKLSELSNSLQNSLEEYQLKEKSQSEQIHNLSEKNVILEKHILELNEKRESYKKRIKVLDDEVKQMNSKFSEEKSSLEVLHQDLLAKNKNLELSVAKLEAKISKFENEKLLVESSASDLQLMVSDKEHQITELKFQLREQSEKLVDLQTLFNQKLNENDKYKHLIETKFPYLHNCKQHFLMIVKALTISYEIDEDISFLESADVKSVDDFTMRSKKIVDHIVECSSEVHSLKSVCSSLESDLTSLQKENANLLSQCLALRNCLVQTTASVESNLKENDIKLNMMLSAFEEKETSVEDLKKKISILSEIQNKKKIHISELEAEKNSYLKKLNDNEITMAKSEDFIKTLMSEKEEINTKYLSMAQQYEEKISNLNVTLQQVTSKCDSLSEMEVIRQGELETSVKKIQELQNLLKAKDEEISRIMKEQQNMSINLNSVHSELASAHSSISSLQNEIRQLNKQINDYSEESHILESSNNVSNGLQVEVENLRHELSFSEEQKNYLQQHIDNTNAQLQSLLGEKSNLESAAEQMQHKLNDLIEANFNLTNSLEESKSLIEYNEERVRNLEEQSSNYRSMYENVYQELKSLQLAKSELESKERMDLTNKVSLLEKNCDSFKNTLIKLNNFFSDAGTSNSEFFNIELEDESLNRLVAELHSNLLQSRKKYIEEIECLKSLTEEVEAKNKILSEELKNTRTIMQLSQKDDHTGIDIDNTKEEITIVCSPVSKQVLDTSMLQQQASSIPTYSADYIVALESDNKLLKQEVNEYKIKFAKVLSKLKVFKDKNEKISTELQELKANTDRLEAMKSESLKKQEQLQASVTSFREENEKLITKLRSIDGQYKSDLDKANDKILQLKERNSVLDADCYRTRKELQEYKHTWEQSNISYELQKEDNERLREKLREMNEQSEDLKAKLSELNLQLTQLKNENSHFKQEAENLREHANMLLSDNDTYQNLIEKLTSTKTSLEQKLSQVKEKFNAESKALQNQFQLELKKLGTQPSETVDTVSQAKKLEVENSSLKSKCAEMEQYTKQIEQERDTYFRNQSLLEKEKVYLQQQLLEKVDELQKTKCNLDDIIKNKAFASVPVSNNSSTNTLVASSDEINQLKEENANLKFQLGNLMQELSTTKGNFESLKQDSYSKEMYYLDTIKQFENQLQSNREVIVNIPSEEKYISDAMNLENELQQAMSSLHKQGLRCEELSLEVSKLLEERNILKWKLQQYGQLNQETKTESDLHDSASSSELISIKVETPSTNVDVATLHARLMESEKTCQQLRQANEALDRALISERDQKKMIEEELDLAKEHLSEEAKASDEYQVLLGEINEPEFFAETNYAISRNVRTHAYKFRRWLRGRRNYLWRMVKSRNYPQLVYIFYIFFIHIWLFTCILS